MQKDTKTFRLSDTDTGRIREYQQNRQLPNMSTALRQMIRLAMLVDRYFCANDEDKKTGRWYQPPIEFLEKTAIDEMKPEERNSFMRGFGHSTADRLGYNNYKKKIDDEEDGPSFDDMFSGGGGGDDKR